VCSSRAKVPPVIDKLEEVVDTWFFLLFLHIKLAARKAASAAAQSPLFAAAKPDSTKGMTF
jgi:hypothetical protein